MSDIDKSELELKLEDFIHDYKVNTPDGWEWKKLVELDEVKKFITQQCNQAEMEAGRKYFERGFYASKSLLINDLPCGEYFDYIPAELETQAKETEGA